MSPTVAVVLAAGLGTRMKSRKPKVLHEIAGVPLIEYVLAAVKQAGIEEIFLVLGHQGEKVKQVLGPNYHYCYQREQLGTGHALQQAWPLLREYTEGTCLVLCGDTPLLKGQTLQKLIAKHKETKAKATVLTAVLDEPKGYGRILKDARGIRKIVEENEATPTEKKVQEINTGTYCFALKSIWAGLKELSPANLQGEYYLTDIIRFLVEKGERVETLLLENSREALGINNRLQLAEVTAYLREEIIEQQMLQGVTIIDPAHTYIGKLVQIGQDTILYPGVILEGTTTIGENCRIGPYTRIMDSFVGADCVVQDSVLWEVKVSRGCLIGPYSYLRPGTKLGEQVKIGDFVEVKNSRVGRGSKIPHLSYVGDSLLGEEVNVGAGTITCNYDGQKKNRTLLEDRVFVGSNTNFVAPVKVGQGAYIGAGSTITKDVPAEALAVARGEQKNLVGWCKKKKREDQHGQ